MTTQLFEKVKKVNNILTAGEPTNVSVDTYGGYTGYKPQNIIDAMNEVFGIGSWGIEEVEQKLTDKKDLIISKSEVWLMDGEKKISMKTWGQSRVTKGDMGDAMKGAQTDAMKKGLSLFSIGNRAYLGLLDVNKKPETSKATKEQMKQIFDVVKVLGVTSKEKAKTYIATACDVKFDTWTELTPKQAEEILGKLEILQVENKQNNQSLT